MHRFYKYFAPTELIPTEPASEHYFRQTRQKIEAGQLGRALFIIHKNNRITARNLRISLTIYGNRLPVSQSVRLSQPYDCVGTPRCHRQAGGLLLY